MSDAIKIELSQEARNITARLGSAEHLMKAVVVETNRQNQLTVDAIAERRLSGKGPFPVGLHRLGERTHRLRPSLRRADATISGSAVESSIGTNVVYAGVHEFGFDGEVTVRPHARKRFERQSFNGLGNRVVRRKVRKADTSVGVFKRKMNIPARAPITTGVEERLPILGAALSRAIVDAWEQTLPQ